MAKKFEDLKRNDGIQVYGIQYVVDTEPYPAGENSLAVKVTTADGTNRTTEIWGLPGDTVEEVLGDFESNATSGNPVDGNFLELAKQGYAWPGGYDLFFVTDDGGVLSAQTVVEEWDTIKDSDRGDGWYIVAADHTGNTDEELIDDHTGDVIGGNPGELYRVFNPDGIPVSKPMTESEAKDKAATLQAGINAAADSGAGAAKRGGKYEVKAAYGNPGEATLHSQLSAAADHVDYEAKVVEAAADEISDKAISDAAHEQADAMEDAAEALDDAADAARDTTAEVFTETGTAQDDQAAGAEGEVIADAVAGNVSTIPNFGDDKFSEMHGNVAEDAKSGFWYGIQDGPQSGRYEIVSGPHQDREHAEAAMKGNPVSEADYSFHYDHAFAWASRQWSPEYAGEYAAWYANQYDDDPDYWGSQAHPSSFNVWLENTEEGQAARQALRLGNPGEAIIEASPVELVAEAAAAPIAETVTAVEAATAIDVAPADAHWYTRPLRKGQ